MRPPQLKVHLKPAHRSGNVVLRTRNLTVGYPGKPLFKCGDTELWYQERAALIGPNGSGKTTFLRTILGELEPLRGEAHLGASLKIGYFAQAHDSLNPQHTVLEELLAHKEMLLGQARNYLAQYLFRGDDVYKTVEMLSGGERARLALALLALQGANLLLLDEPTNHLDIPAQEVLQDVLEGFGGTILLVSHDRYLVDKLATQVWDLRNDGKLHVFNGGYPEYLANRERRVDESKQSGVKQRTEAREQVVQARKVNNEARKHERAVEQMEIQIHQQEALLARLAGDMQEASARGAVDKIQRLGAEYAAQQGHLEKLLGEWERVAVTAPAK
jgi:ATP-binding cassette subfamily F protein 3